jgi:3-hydroxybutyryl-CoA dehydratase
MLTAGLISTVLGMKLPGAGSIYLSQSLRFTRPVRIGDTVTATVAVLAVIAAKRRVQLATRCFNQLGELVLDGRDTRHTG